MSDELLRLAGEFRGFAEREGNEPILCSRMHFAEWADAIERTFPADDGEPVTADFLRAIGFRDSDGCQAIPAANGSTLQYAGGGWFYGWDAEPLPDQPTRGHVRRLLAVFGVPLTEGNHA